MSGNQLVFELILNIGLLVLIANLISKMKLMRTMLLQETDSWQRQVFLSLLFGGIIVLSTYTSISIDGCDFNTRLISAVASGLLGGPVVGLYASFIGALHAYYYLYGTSFATAAAFSTVLFGLLGGGFYPYFQRGKWKYVDLFLLACFAEACDIVVILRLTTPFQLAFATVLKIGLPMIFFNSFGLLLFISSFNTVFIQQDIESSRQLKLVSDLSGKCMPLLNQGLLKNDNIHKMVSILLNETDWSGVMITGRTQIIEWQKKGIALEFDDPSVLPEAVRSVMESGCAATVNQVAPDNPFHEIVKDYVMLAAPFLINNQSVGCMMVLTKKQWMVRKSELELLQNIVTIGSAQLAVVELEKQKQMRQKAEFKALQSQVNPHFLFNALNTISCVCRENPERARELLVILATYFRYNLDAESYMIPLQDELQHIKNYLELEQARFEDKLEVRYEIPEAFNIMVPTLILQPIVENAVRHGVGAMGFRHVTICAKETETEVVVSIRDKGKGFPEKVLAGLDCDCVGERSIGLVNVHKRMKSIYGEDHGLKITSTQEGSFVELHFIKNSK